jgi:autotransporter-associated beta strand protein
MAVITKASTAGTTNLASSSAWNAIAPDPARVPTTGDIARWLTTSLGPGLTGALTVDGIEQQGATANITHSTGTLTLGASGFTQTAANNRNWAESGVLAIGAVDQTWSLAFPTVSPATSALSIGGAAGLTGTGILSLANNSGTSDPLRAIMTVAGANAGFAGTLRLLTNSCINFNAVGCLTGCNIEVNGDGAYLRNVGAHSFGAAGKTLTFNANGKMGNTAGVMTCNSPVDLSAAQRAITFVHDVTFAAALSGTAGVSMLKSDTAWCDVGFQSLSPSLTTTNGAISIGNYIAAQLYPESWFFSGARDFEVDGIFICGAASTAGFTSPQALPAGTQFTGSGAVGVQFNSTNLVTFPAGALIGLTGDLDPATTFSSALGSQNYARSGLCLNVVPFYARGQSCNVAVNDLPVRLGFRGASNGAGDFGVNRLFYIGPGATYPNTQIDVIAAITDADAPNASHEIYANCSDSAPLVIGRGIKRLGISTTQRMTLRGTSTADNEIQGPINPNGLGTLNITKSDAGKWALSGNNTYTGTTAIGEGTLSARSTSAFGSSSTGAVTQTGGTIELYSTGSMSLNKGTSWALTSVSGANSISVPSGQISINPSAITLGTAATKINVNSESSLIINNVGAISGLGFGIEKSGLGSLTLNNSSNTFTGNFTVNGGDILLATIANSGSAASWGAGSNSVNIPSLLKITGAGGSTNRTINLAGTTTTINSSGSNPVSFSSVTQSSGYRVIALDGTNAGNNTISAPIGNGSVGSSTQIAKNGSGKWKLTGALTYTGITEVNEGTLNIGSISQTFANDVILSAGTRLEADSGGSCSGAFYCTGAQIYTPLNTFSVTLNGTSEIGSLLSGNGSLYVNAGTTTIESESTNTYSGTSTVSSGSTVVARALQNPSSLSTGKVFGDSNLSMGGTLYTASTGNQQGKLRYGGSVTFGTGAQIHIGGA